MSSKYFDRELSWLSFNERVLQEAKDKTVPLYERIKFLAIWSSNLDEFFRVRVASLRSLLELKKKAHDKIKFKPHTLLNEIIRRVNLQQEEFGRILRDEVLPGLEDENIFLVNDKSVPPEHRDYLENYFQEQVLPFIQPTLLDKNKIATFLHNKAIYLALRLKVKSKTQAKHIRYKYALVEIPANRLGRFIALPGDDNNYVIFLDDVIRMFLPKILPGYDIESCYSIKLTRDAGIYIDDEFSGNLLAKIKKGLSKRKTGVPSRFLYDKKMPAQFLRFLKESLQLDKDDLIAGGRYHNFNDFFSFPKFEKTELEYESFPTLPCKELEGGVSVFKVMAKRDILLSFPYQSYGNVIKFLENAADDKSVKSIKITLYRVAEESLVVHSLIKAAENGKKVTAFVEVKARFDEESNFASYEALEKAGVKVFSSFPGLKVHSKLCLIERKENEKVKLYTYLGTGNFNEKTAKIYCDYALLTANQDIGKEAIKVFNFLERKTEEETFEQLLVAPFNIRTVFIQLIDNEIKNAVDGKKAEIIIKLNSLEDRKMIKKLYQASSSGVIIKIIVRGICCLLPGVKGLSENIKVVSVIDRFLEHARIFIFHNNGDRKYYVASADWMKRNLSRRVEVCFPINDERLQTQFQKMIDLQWNDNVKARIVDKDQLNKYFEDKKDKKTRSQYKIYDFIRSLN
ncbi:MAG: polyphosphate kinase 1 [Candidatus Cloacimonadota bacterium]|nr:MAG: polyphosphate kinase 1 [Candidatus Cloacimonadota bacterium]